MLGLKRTGWLLAALATVGGAALACSSETSTTTAAPPFKDKEIGLEVDLVDHPAVHKNADGTWGFEEEEIIKMDGAPDHTIIVSEVDEPVEKGGKETLTIKDKVTGESRSYVFDPMTNSISIVDGTLRVVIVQNPDHTYSLDADTVRVSAKDLIALLRKNAIYTADPPYSVLAAYANAQQPAPDAPRSVPGGPDSSSQASGNGASAPSICGAAFKDLCECIVCDKSAHPNCSTCP